MSGPMAFERGPNWGCIAALVLMVICWLVLALAIRAWANPPTPTNPIGMGAPHHRCQPHTGGHCNRHGHENPKENPMTREPA